MNENEDTQRPFPELDSKQRFQKEEVKSLLTPLHQQIVLFLEKAARRPLAGHREQLQMDFGFVYLRTSGRLLEAQAVRCLDLGHIEFFSEYQGRGLFTPLLQLLVRLNPYEAFYIESVLNSRIERWCERHGWHFRPLSSPPSFYLLASEKEAFLRESEEERENACFSDE